MRCCHITKEQKPTPNTNKIMKTQIASIAAAALFLALTPLAHAGTPAKAKKHATAKTVQTTTVDYNTVTIRANQPDTVTAGGEIGNDAPHEERNPSAHPELFQIAR